MQLVQVSSSPFAARLRLLIYRKNAAVELVRPPADGLKGPDFLALNPIGKIPVLILDDGSTLPESGVILEYLEDKFPTPPLRPAGPEAVARMRLIGQIADTYLAPPLVELFGQASPERRSPERVARAAAGLSRGFGFLEHHLGPGPFAAGAAYSLADCSLIPILFFARLMAQMLDLPDPLTMPRASAYWAEIGRDEVSQRVLGEMAEGVRRMLARSGS